jgi:beta-N-acetylhexosaminidase
MKGRGMDDLESVGQHFMIGLRPAATLHPLDRQLLQDLRPAGVVLFKSNFSHDLPYREWLDGHARLIAAIREATGRERLMIAIDHEGGRVCRTPAPITRYAYARSWQDRCGEVGAAMGVELRSLGINLNFAPVLDIDSNPHNPVIGARSFGHTPETVAASACDFMDRMEANGVRACGKHFPGHGDTRVDSHRELPVIEATSETLRDRELKPFAAAIGRGIGMIMTAHIVFKALDDKLPATLSRRITQDLLRTELGFEGVIVSDDIGMHAVSAMFENPDAAVQFMAAGNDMLMICAHWTDTERARFLARAIIDARRSGSLDGRLLDRAQQRIHTMLDQTQQNSVRELPDGIFLRHAKAGPLYSEPTVEVT